MPLTNFNNYNKQYYYGSSYIEDEDNKTTAATTLKQLPPRATILTKAPATTSNTFTKMPAKYAVHTNATTAATHTNAITTATVTITPTKSSSLLLSPKATTTIASVLARGASVSSSSSLVGVAATSLPLSSFASSSAYSLSGAVAVYPQMKKYCRRFLFVISLVCLLHSCLLWNTAEAAISNRGKFLSALVFFPIILIEFLLTAIRTLKCYLCI